ncbi:MAG TPA: histidine phosphatase family protein [Patescibacteria group bacterium]
MKVYITRHGESVSNAEGYIAFSYTGLSDKGMEDAKKLGERLAKENIKIDAIYCSSLYRTLQTMDQIFKGGFKIDPKKVIVTDLVREINRAEYEGVPSTEYYAVRDASGMDPDDFKCKGGESENDVKRRAAEFKKMIEESGYENILVVTHGHFIGRFNSLFGMKLEHTTGGALSLLEIEGGKAEVKFWNDTSHLEESKVTA